MRSKRIYFATALRRVCVLFSCLSRLTYDFSSLRWMKSELLNSPIGEFTNIECVGIAAVDLIYRAEFFRPLARRAELPEHLPVQIHFVDLPIFHGVRRVRV